MLGFDKLLFFIFCFPLDSFHQHLLGLDDCFDSNDAIFFSLDVGVLLFDLGLRNQPLGEGFEVSCE